MDKMEERTSVSWIWQIWQIEEESSLIQIL